MDGKFVLSADIERDQLEWGEFGWVSRPSSTESRYIIEMEVILNPGSGHNFHLHPNQEEVIRVMSGEIEQWLKTEKQVLKPGDSVFIAPGVVHASFNLGREPVKLLVVLSPCVGEAGYELVDVSGEAPWNSLR